MKKLLMWCREMLIPRKQSKRQIARDMGIMLGLLVGAALLCRFACDQADLLAERNRPILDATSSMSDNEYLFWLFDARRASLENANVDKRKLRAQLDKSKREADKLKDKVAQIYESRSYRIGNSLVKGPSKIIKKLKGYR